MTNETLITDETLTPELAALGYAVGDVMPVPPIVGEEEFTVTQEFIDAQPADMVEVSQLAVGDVIKRPILGDIPAKEVAPVEDAATENLAVPEEAVETVEETATVEEAVVEAPVAYTNAPVKVFEGKVVISEGTREVEGKTYIALRLEDGTMHDLTQEDYETKVVTRD